MSDLIANIAAVRAEIAASCQRAGRDPKDVTLIAVTKNQSPDVVPLLHAAGITDIGENRYEHQQFMANAAPTGMRIHAIGRIQSRQLSSLVPISNFIHSLADPSHIKKLSQACISSGKRMSVYVQVNTSGEASKAGINPQDLGSMLDQIYKHPELDALGLMTMAPIDDHKINHTSDTGSAHNQAEKDLIRRCFSDLRELAMRHHLPGLSMGMSQDFPIAIEEGATVVRVGTRLFA